MVCWACTTGKLKCDLKAKWADEREKELQREKLALLEAQMMVQLEPEVPDVPTDPKKAVDAPKPAKPAKTKPKKRSMFGEYLCHSFPIYSDVAQMLWMS